MVQNDIYDYKKIVGEQNQEEYLGPEHQGELLKDVRFWKMWNLATVEIFV